MARRTESRKLETTAAVMSALGGPVVVSALTGASYKNVWSWTSAPQFPSRYYVLMTWALKQKRMSAPASLWGQVTIPEMERVAA